MAMIFGQRAVPDDPFNFKHQAHRALGNFHKVCKVLRLAVEFQVKTGHDGLVVGVRVLITDLLGHRFGAPEKAMLLLFVGKVKVVYRAA